MVNVCVLTDLRGERTLRKPSKRVRKFGTVDLLLLQQMMIAAAKQFEANNPDRLCVGLAAPQVGINLRVIMVRNSTHRNNQGWTFMFNPVYVDSRDGFTCEVEGCLSIPGLEAKVVRPKESLFYYFDEKGQRQPKNGEYHLVRDEFARVLCHELDHLNGVLFSDNAIDFTGMKVDGVDESPTTV